MKKVLATVAALGLVLGVTANALALDQPGRVSEGETTTDPRVPAPTAPGVALWSVAGQWTLAGAYISNAYGAPGGAAVDSSSDSNDAFYIYSFKILPVLQVNDKISMKGELRIADRGILGSTDLSQDTDANFYTVYMEWMSPLGKTRFGRTPAGAWGTSKWNNSTRQGQRLMWWLGMMPQNWGSLIFTEKLAEEDATNGVNNSDEDRDAYYADLSYKADFGKTVAALWVVRDARNAAADAHTSWDLWLNGKYTFGDFLFEYEVDYRFGEASPTVDWDALGFVADLGWKTGDWTLGGIFIYGSGDDTVDGDAEAIYSNGNGTGKDYNPYQIMMGDYMNMWNGDKGVGGINSALQNGQGNAGLWSIGAYTKFNMSPKTSLSAEVGYFAATDEASGYDDEYGIEFGVGLGYKIMDNLSYNAHFSYLSTGDYFAEGGASDTEDIYLVAHALSMKF